MPASTPDLATRDILAANPGMPPEEANSLAWRKGFSMLSDSVRNGTRYAFETTLGGRSVTDKLLEACAAGIPVYLWYCALASPELHISRVAARVQKGGHDIPEEKIRQRYQTSRENLIGLLPFVTSARVFDNSEETPSQPKPLLVLAMDHQKIVHADLAKTPDWAKSIVAAAVQIDPAYFGTPAPPKPRLRVIR